MRAEEAFPSGVDTSSWKSVGSTSNSDYFESEPDVLVIIPHQNCADTKETANENVDFQHTHWKKNGRSGACIILFDHPSSQDKGARRVYAERSDLTVQTCAALVGGTALGRAIAGFFIGLSRPKIPTELFGDFESALLWSRRMNREHGHTIQL